MKDHVYKLIELTGTPTSSIEDAVDKAVNPIHHTQKIRALMRQLIEHLREDVVRVTEPNVLNALCFPRDNSQSPITHKYFHTNDIITISP